MKLVILFLQYKNRYPKAFENLKKYLEKLNCEKKIIVIDNSIDNVLPNSYEFSLIAGDNTEGEFSGWDRGLKYIKDEKIKYDMILFVNDSFMNRGIGGSPSTIISQKNLIKCSQGKAIQNIIEDNAGFVITDNKINVRGRSHCFMLPKSIVERLKKITTIKKDDKVLINDKLRNHLEAALEIKDAEDKGVKKLALLNEMSLSQRINDIEDDWKYQIDISGAVVFDIFDVAICRKLRTKKELLYHLGQDFPGEREVAVSLMKDDYTIFDLYKYLPGYKHSNEIILEETNCYQNKEIYELYRYAVDKKKKIMFHYSGCLPHDSIKRMLVKCKYKNPQVVTKYLLSYDLEYCDSVLFLNKNTYNRNKSKEDFWYEFGYNIVGCFGHLILEEPDIIEEKLGQILKKVPKQYIDQISKGTIDFVNDARYMIINDHRKLGVFKLNRMLNSPTEEEAKYLGDEPDLEFLEEQREQTENKIMFDVNVKRIIGKL